jgi:hypothetical protein
MIADCFTPTPTAHRGANKLYKNQFQTIYRLHLVLTERVLLLSVYLTYMKPTETREIYE